jgi:hypothetical protein
MLPLLLTLIAQDPTPYKIEARLEAKPTPDGQVFAVSGSGDFPEGSVIRIDVFRGATMEGHQYESKMVMTRGGRFEREFRVFPKTVPPGQSAARIWFDVELQPSEEVKKAVQAAGRAPRAEVWAPLVVGTYEEFNRARKAHAAKLDADLASIASAVNEAFEAFKGRGDQSPADLRERLEALIRKIEEIDEGRRNLTLLDFHYAVTDVSGTMFERLKRSAVQAIRRIEGGVEGGDPLPHAQPARADCLKWAEEGRRILAYILMDRVAAAPVVAELHGMLEGLMRMAAESPAPEAMKKEVERAKRKSLDLQMKLAYAMGADGYGIVSTVSEETGRLLQALESADDPAAAEAWKRVRAALDQLTSR